MVIFTFAGVSASINGRPNFAAEIKNEVTMNAKRNLLLAAGVLLAVATSQAQLENPV